MKQCFEEKCHVVSYNGVHFLQNILNKYPIAHPQKRAMGAIVSEG